MSTVVTNKIMNVAGTKSVSVDGLSAVDDTGKNICTAWVNFDGTNGTIKDSYNVSSVVVVSTGKYDITFLSTLTTSNYSIGGIASNSTTSADDRFISGGYGDTTKVHIEVRGLSGSTENAAIVNVLIFGGKN